MKITLNSEFRGCRAESSSIHSPKFMYLRWLHMFVVSEVWAYTALRQLWKLLKCSTWQRSQARILVQEFRFLNFMLEGGYCYTLFHVSWFGAFYFCCSFWQSFKTHYLDEHPPKENTINNQICRWRLRVVLCKDAVACSKTASFLSGLCCN